MKAILLAALIAAGAYGAHYLTTHPNLSQAPQSEAIVEASPADAAIEPDRDHAQKRLSELEADNQNLAARLKEANDRLQAAALTANQWQEQAKKYQNEAVAAEAVVSQWKDSWVKTNKDREDWQAYAAQWKSIAETSANTAEQNRLIAEQHSRAAQAAQWQADADQRAREMAALYNRPKPTTKHAQPEPTPQVIEIESNGKWATDSAGNAYRIDSLGGRKIIDMTK